MVIGDNIAIAIVPCALVLIIIVALIFLQIFLSRKSNKWLGLILPVISLGISLIETYNIAMPSRIIQEQVNSNGDIISRSTVTSEVNIVGIIIYFLILNIPTLIYLLIYFASRSKIKKKSQLDKMTIQDLD